MSITAMSPVRICHALECFYLGIDMFNGNTPSREFFIICFFLFAQLMVLTSLYRNETVCMVSFYPLVSKISVKGYRITDTFSYCFFIYLEIMLAAFGFLYIDDAQTAPLNDDLRLQRMPFFFLNNTLFDPFEGGLSGFR